MIDLNAEIVLSRRTISAFFVAQAGATGFEPAVSALTGPHVSHYTTPPSELYNITGSKMRQGISRKGAVQNLLLDNPNCVI
jgi:hypothetical protein